MTPIEGTYVIFMAVGVAFQVALIRQGFRELRAADATRVAWTTVGLAVLAGFSLEAVALFRPVSGLPSGPLAVLGGAIALLPFFAPSLFVRMPGGQDKNLALRRASVELAKSALGGRPRSDEELRAMRRRIASLDRLRTSETDELVSIMSAYYGDWLDGVPFDAEAQRRQQRMSELADQLWSDSVQHLA